MLDDAITMSHRMSMSWNFTSTLLLSIKYDNVCKRFSAWRL